MEILFATVLSACCCTSTSSEYGARQYGPGTQLQQQCIFPVFFLFRSAVRLDIGPCCVHHCPWRWILCMWGHAAVSTLCDFLCGESREAVLAESWQLVWAVASRYKYCVLNVVRVRCLGVANIYTPYTIIKIIHPPLGRISDPVSSKTWEAHAQQRNGGFGKMSPSRQGCIDSSLGVFSTPCPLSRNQAKKIVREGVISCVLYSIGPPKRKYPPEGPKNRMLAFFWKTLRKVGQEIGSLVISTLNPTWYIIAYMLKVVWRFRPNKNIRLAQITKVYLVGGPIP